MNQPNPTPWPEQDPALSALCHNRAREANSEARKLVTGLSTASLGVIFLMLFDVEKLIIASHPWTAGVLVLGMALATLAGLLAWKADAKRHWHWAQIADGKPVAKHEPKRDCWQSLMRLADVLQQSFFALGVAAAAWLLLQRLAQIEKRQAAPTSQAQKGQAARPSPVPIAEPGKLHSTP